MPTVADAVIAPMQGAGFYNENSAVQAAGVRLVLPLLAQAAASVTLGAGEPLVIVDYGASQGRNSMAPMRVAIEGLRARAGADRPVEVVHTDLPSNDFGSLFTALYDGPESYLAETSGVFPSVIGRSYFHPLLPPGRVHLGWNSWTLHWLREAPPLVPNHLHSALSGDPAVSAQIVRQAADDWRRFLAARSSELRPGGKFVSLSCGRSDAAYGWEWLFGELWAAATDLAAAGHLTEQELLRMNLPTAHRSLAEIRAPFGETGRCAGLTLEHAAIVEAPDPFWERFLVTRDNQHLGRAWSNALRASTGPSLVAALDPGRDRGAVLDALFARYADRLAATPQRHEHSMAVVVLAKDTAGAA